jgi:hypothetical protein
MPNCAGPAPLAEPPAAPRAAVSYDGRYEGTMRVTGGPGTASNPSLCGTPPRVSIEVRNNRFTLAVPHPDAEATPSLRDRATPTYDATIRPDGSITGMSNDTGATMDGRVSGTRMNGQVYGLLCYYEFTALRV